MFSILAAVGQIFVYRMAKHFKQHIVPFVITTRKIFTVVISIIVFHHSTTLVQVLGIVIVFGAACFEYWTEIFNTKKIVRI
jgi:UDP-galactose transporter B1